MLGHGHVLGVGPARWEHDAADGAAVLETPRPVSCRPLGVEAGQLTGAIADWSMEHGRQILVARREFDADRS